MQNSDKPQSAFDKLDINKIGSGHRFTEGTWNRGMGSGINKDAGLKGQLRNFQIAGKKGITKNLSTQNIKQTYGLIADRIKSKAASSGVFLNRRDRTAIMKESRALVKEKGSNFTREDRKDLIKMVDTLRRKSREALRGDRGNSLPVAPRPTPPASPPPTQMLPPLPSNFNNFGGGLRGRI